jgi:hypothetical protein
MEDGRSLEFYLKKYEKLRGRYSKRQALREQYGLLDRRYAQANPSDYLRYLTASTNELGFSVRGIHEYEAFFALPAVEVDSQTFYAGAACLDQAQILLLPHPETTEVERLIRFHEHELVHAYQATRQPRMGIWRREYEAYLATNDRPPSDKYSRMKVSAGIWDSVRFYNKHMRPK